MSRQVLDKIIVRPEEKDRTGGRLEESKKKEIGFVILVQGGKTGS